jgi:hypothetical protein
MKGKVPLGDRGRLGMERPFRRIKQSAVKDVRGIGLQWASPEQAYRKKKDDVPMDQHKDKGITFIG